MALRPATVLADIIAQIEATSPHVDHAVSRPAREGDGFRHYPLAGDETFAGERGFQLELTSAPQKNPDATLCHLRTMGLQLVIHYAHTANVWGRVANDADALEVAIEALATSTSTVDHSQLAGEMPVDLMLDGRHVLLTVPFDVIYSRGT